MCAESIFTGRANSNFCYNFPKTAFRGIQSYAACRISHALIHVERYLLRRITEKKKKKREVRKKFVIGTNEYVQRIFIRIQDLFMRAISNDPKASSFGIFSKNRGINETIRIL